MSAMNSVYTTTITAEARRRGVGIEVIDPVTPIFVLKHGRRSVRCYNALTDHVGAVTFHMAQNKRLANKFLHDRGFRVPDQQFYTAMDAAQAFLKQHRCIVVKPCTQWGGRGVSVGVRTRSDLVRAIQLARRFEEEIVLEEQVSGVDQRLIFVDFRFVASIQRNPARVVGDGHATLRQLIMRRNRDERRVDPSHRIPLDAETGRNLKALGVDWDTVPRAGKSVQVRLTSNYHTGGSIDITTDTIDRRLVQTAERAVRLLNLPVVGIDFLVNPKTGRYWIIELSPDLAISPPEGEEVAKRFMDYLFPATRRRARG